ncbi:vesicle transport through interaction with t-SNAREs homolog 1B [Nilaparvata lugens]|uniref:vesicle transport through interaction with t-SNAREs homolog 1B n=1 Tax=Nilaparvata lugens TaxID=108931 RepID=UPI000B98C715|nr:vesicle transport through interaction with t-SNAREs homolog 1B [Nilaparvata lugens]
MNNWEGRQRQVLQEGTSALERTADSLRRSERTALETEAIGATVVAELGQQRESLIRASNRLNNIDENMSRTRSILNAMTRNILTNKLILILIILSEVGILGCLLYIKLKK